MSIFTKNTIICFDCNFPNILQIPFVHHCRDNSAITSLDRKVHCGRVPMLIDGLTCYWSRCDSGTLGPPNNVHLQLSPCTRDILAALVARPGPIMPAPGSDYRVASEAFVRPLLSAHWPVVEFCDCLNFSWFSIGGAICHTTWLFCGRNLSRSQCRFVFALH